MFNTATLDGKNSDTSSKRKTGSPQTGNRIAVNLAKGHLSKPFNPSKTEQAETYQAIASNAPAEAATPMSGK